MSDTDMVGVSIDREKHTVLVVDDNPATRYSTARVLRAAGFRTMEAATGQEALDAAGAHDVSAVVLDVHLPDFDGFEVCRRLRGVTRTAVVPVIHLSATYVEDRHKVQGLNSGADAYITHPAEPPILVATVQALVRARMAEDEVRRSGAKFRAIYIQAESGIALIDAEGRFVEANPAMLKMLGRREADVVGQPVSRFASPSSQEAVRRMEIHAAAEEFKRETFSIVQPDGTEVHVEWSMSRYADPGLRIGIASNISDRMALEQQRQQLLEREQAARVAAEKHSQTKDDFVAVLSHELRNPLNAMVMGLHMLQRHPVSPQVAAGLRMIEKNAQIQARIISDILDVSRLNSGKLTLSRELVDAANITEVTLESMKTSIDERQIKVVTDLASGRGEVWIDPTRFQQVLWNILTNAVKFSQPQGRIVVLLTRNESVMQLVVRDYGKGIEPEFLDKVFDKFSQNVSPENRAHGGLGLGMSIVKHLVELHGGTVKVESAGLGRGTTVKAEFPLINPEPHSAEGEFQDSSKADGEERIRGLRVLVVEDDPVSLDMLSMILRDRGAEVSTAASFDMAMLAFEADRPAVLVSDIGLPGKDGYELIREIRKREAAGNRTAVWAIALTAFGRAEDKGIALKAGYDLHIAKPLRPHKLLSAIAGWVRSRDEV